MYFSDCCEIFQGNIQEAIVKMQLLNLSVSHPVALQQYLPYMNETLTLNRHFFFLLALAPQKKKKKSFSR